MDEKKLHTHRPKTLDSVGGISAGRPGSTGNVIDLRQAPGAKPPRTDRPSQVVNRPKRSAAALSPAAAQSYSQRSRPDEPAHKKATKASTKAEAAPAATHDTLDTLPPANRFWPAFWRFLVLLVILGLIVTGGLYLYLNYYHS